MFPVSQSTSMQLVFMHLSLVTKSPLADVICINFCLILITFGIEDVNTVLTGIVPTKNIPKFCSTVFNDQFNSDANVRKRLGR